MDTSFLDLFQLLIGIYLGYCALFNKGKIYENANVKEGKEKEYRKIMRVMLLILSPIIIAVGLLGTSGLQQDIRLYALHGAVDPFAGRIWSFDVLHGALDGSDQGQGAKRRQRPQKTSRV